MNRARRVALILILVCPLALGTGCSSAGTRGGERTVFSIETDFGQGLRGVRPIDVVDLGLPDLYNLTDQKVRLRAVTLVSAPSAMRVRSVTAYVYPNAGGLGIGRGDLLRYCHKTDRPYPITAAEAPPHGRANWLVVIAFTITRPGRYQIRRAKISYAIDGHPGWQYQNINTTIYGVPTPPGAKPHMDGCL